MPCLNHDMQRSLAAFSVTMNQIVAVVSMPPIPHGSPWVLNITKPCSVLSTWFWMRDGRGRPGKSRSASCLF